MKLWGGRFEEGASEVFERFSGSLHFDRRLADVDIRGSQAYARALEGVGILTSAEREQIVAAFDAIRAEARTPAFFENAGGAPCDDEDVHTLIIRKLHERAGRLADKIHTGRSRNDQVSLDIRLWLREEIDAIHESLLALQASLINTARRDPQAIIPGYTHTRRAQPVLWTHYLLAYFEMFARDAERLMEARKRVDVMPLGSGALAGSGLPFDREAIARDLGFAAITTNSMDVSGDRDFALDFMHAASMTMLHLSRLAEDWILYSGEEYGWLELGDGVTSGSSMMPQKKNPDSLELIRGKCGGVFGDYAALFMTMKALPMTYNRDMQEDKPRLFDAADQLRASLEMTRVVIETTRLRPEPPLKAINDSWTVATDLADALARSGVEFHQAHKIVGRLVLESVRDSKKPADWTPESLAKFDPAFTAEMARFLQPAEGIQTRELPGGTGPHAVADALDKAEQRLNHARALRRDRMERSIE
jgi:argininosuccinate lyase